MKKGFTLIELLIVIGILAILAIGLIAALDPLEQLKRGRDTSTRAAVEETYNAALRYYSVKEDFPWGTTPQTTQGINVMATTYVQSLIGAGELKANFVDDTNKLSKIFLTSTHADIYSKMDDVSVCFAPESKAIRGDANSKYNQAGVTATGCPTSDYSTVTCFWCVK